MGRRDDPKFGKDEVVYSVLIRFTRHLVLEYGNDMMTACRGVRVQVENVVAVKARKITCRHCRSSKYLNLE